MDGQEPWPFFPWEGSGSRAGLCGADGFYKGFYEARAEGLRVAPVGTGTRGAWDVVEEPEGETRDV